MLDSVFELKSTNHAIDLKIRFGRFDSIAQSPLIIAKP